MRNLKIAVIGAGVAGLSFAIFAKQKGFDVTVFEREKQISTIGAGVTLWPNACFVLEKMGVLETLKSLGGLPNSIRQCDRFGKLNSRIDIEEINRLSGSPTITVLRRDLMQVLYARLNELEGEIYFQRKISSSYLTNLKSEFDLVVGGDGRMRSVVREELYPDKELLRYHGFINIIGISAIDSPLLYQTISEFRGGKERFGIVSVQANLCYWAAAWDCDISRNRPRWSWYEEMKARFSDWAPIIPQLLENTEQGSLNRIFVHDTDPLPFWHKDNLLVIGDAAHAPLPTSGQGACQALEDAWHLSETLSQFSSFQKALNHFYESRIEKVTFAQQAGRAVASQIFSEKSDIASSSLPSPKQLSDIWMKGLVAR